MNQSQYPIVRAIKALANFFALLIVLLPALTSWLEDRLHAGSEGVFGFWAQLLALLPGHPGVYLRRAFYHLTLRSCSLNTWIGFGALFFHRQTHVEDEVYVGPYAVVGSARLRVGSLIGTRASLMSGSVQHELREDGGWTPSERGRFQQIEIGPRAWIGEAAAVMADVGAGAMVAAGSVVSTAVPSNIVVAGNPARFVREIKAGTSKADSPSASTAITHYAAFIDWLKCLGMVVIVYGHVAAWAQLATLPPINVKQLGVAFFLFITGYSLTRETRERWHVAFNRLFEVYLFGAALAVILSVVTYLTHGGLQISNYGPLLGGVSVVFNFFPANPTTWYLGTYMHVIVLWALVVSRIRVSIALIGGAFICEIVLRALLMQTAGLFVAYMLLPNWQTVFLLGIWYGQRRSRVPNVSSLASLGAGVTLALALFGWSALAVRLPFERSFPYMQLVSAEPMVGLVLTSILVSVLYVGATWLAFHAVAALPAPVPVRFVARNTLIVFLGHMPVYYLLWPVLRTWGISRSLQSAILMVVCVIGLGFLSELIQRVLQPRRWRDRLYAQLRRSANAPALPIPSSKPTTGRAELLRR